MKKMIALVLGMMTLALAAGCNGKTVECSVTQVAAGTLAPAIASGLQCTNPAAIQATLIQYGTQAGLCPATGQQSSALSAICSTVSGLVLDQVAKNGIPASWGCSATNAKSLVQGVVNQACAKL